VRSQSTGSYRFGDLLALARQSWVLQMTHRLSALGYQDYRRSDAAVVRLLRRGPAPVGSLAPMLGVTRQAARKVAGGLERRGLARTERDATDARVLNVELTAAGAAYAAAVSAVIDELNQEFCQRLDRGDLAAADAVLRAVVDWDGTLSASAARIAPPGGQSR
jgi:DNA-binding MarR family transcriptional regulator